VKLHKVYNTENKLIPCVGTTEIFVLKSGLHVSGVTGGSRERKGSSTDTMDGKIEAIYKMIKEMKDERIGNYLIKKAIKEAVEEEIYTVRCELQT